jgi:hypothetical protein
MSKSKQAAARVLASLQTRLPQGAGFTDPDGGAAGAWHDVVRELVKNSKSEHWTAADAARELASAEARAAWGLPPIAKYSGKAPKRAPKRAAAAAAAAAPAAAPAPILRRSTRAKKATGKGLLFSGLAGHALRKLFGAGYEPADSGSAAAPQREREVPAGGFFPGFGVLASVAAPLAFEGIRKLIGRGLPMDADAAESGLKKRRAKAGPNDARVVRGQAISRIMREHQMTLGEASKHLKAHPELM